MKNLLLMRHATTADKELGQQDVDRELTLLGERQAGQMGLWLKSQQLVPQLILCSPAARTRTTMVYVQECFDKPVLMQLEQGIYQGSEKELRYLVQEVDDDVETILLIGHNPTISSFAAQLMHDPEEPVNFAPATIMWLQLTGTSWQEIRPRSCQVKDVYQG